MESFFFFDKYSLFKLILKCFNFFFFNWYPPFKNINLFILIGG